MKVDLTEKMLNLIAEEGFGFPKLVDILHHPKHGKAYIWQKHEGGYDYDVESEGKRINHQEAFDNIRQRMLQRGYKHVKEEVELDESMGTKSFKVMGKYSDKDGNIASVTHKIDHVKDKEHAKYVAKLRNSNRFNNYKIQRATEITEDSLEEAMGKDSAEYGTSDYNAHNSLTKSTPKIASGNVTALHHTGPERKPTVLQFRSSHEAKRHFERSSKPGEMMNIKRGERDLGSLSNVKGTISHRMVEETDAQKRLKDHINKVLEKNRNVTDVPKPLPNILSPAARRALIAKDNEALKAKGIEPVIKDKEKND